MAETTVHRFRTAMGGFHKGDVSAYITKTAVQHRKEIAALEEQLAQQQEENEALRAKLAELEAEAAAPREEPPAEALSPDTALEAGIEKQELDAYRRAEAAERLAYQRAGRLYEDMQHIYEKSGGQLQTVSQAAKDAMEALDSAMDNLMSTLEKTRMEAQTSTRELEAMGALVPDPAEGLEDTE